MTRYNNDPVMGMKTMRPPIMPTVERGTCDMEPVGLHSQGKTCKNFTVYTDEKPTRPNWVLLFYLGLIAFILGALLR